MAGRGPAPSASRSRRRDNDRREAETTTVVDQGELYGPDLPAGVLPNGEEWHSQTVALWNSLRRSALMADEPDLGWMVLIDTALMHHTMWSKGRWEFAAEVRLRLGKFGATPEDRQRLKVKVEKPGAGTAVAPPRPGARRSEVTNIASRRSRLTS